MCWSERNGQHTASFESRHEKASLSWILYLEAAVGCHFVFAAFGDGHWIEQRVGHCRGHCVGCLEREREKMRKGKMRSSCLVGQGKGWPGKQ